MADHLTTPEDGREFLRGVMQPSQQCRCLSDLAVGEVPPSWRNMTGQERQLAQQLAASLRPGRWYADYATGSIRWVVFAGRIFKYPRADRDGYAEAAEAARSVGVPQAQLDWPA
nr:hypothetical protein [Micromonospora inositola]